MGEAVKKLVVCTAVLALTACQQRTPSPPEASPARVSQVPEQDQQALYMLGVSVARRHASFHFTAEELRYVKAGMKDQALGQERATRLRLDMQSVEALKNRRAAAHAAQEKLKAQPFLEQAAKEQGVEKTASGLIFRSLSEGTGPSPSSTDTVRVHYRALLADGTEFDSSSRHGGPYQLNVGAVFRCWSEGLLRMKVGGKAKLVCPSELTFGDEGIEFKVPGGAATVVELELLEIVP